MIRRMLWAVGGQGRRRRRHTDEGAVPKGRLQGLGPPGMDPERLRVTYTGSQGESIFWGSGVG